MSTVISKDGSTIAYDKIGEGPAIILVDGALCTRAMGPSVKLAPALAARGFTVFTYDRRGRGESTESSAYTVDREIDDLAAILEKSGPARMFGHSSGAVLALQAAARGLPISKLALYEPPLVVDQSRPSTEKDWLQIAHAMAANQRSEAVKAFLRCVGVPGLVIAIMRMTPVWPKLTAVAHTLPHDGAIVSPLQRGEPLPSGAWNQVKIPTLAVAGGKSPAWMQAGVRALASAVPNAKYRTLDGQNHDVSAKAIAPVLAEMFAA